MAKVAIFLAEGFEEIEGLTVVDILRRGGISVDMVSISGALTVTGSHDITVTVNKLLAEVQMGDYDMVVLPGGMPGTRNLQKCEILTKGLLEFAKTGKAMAAICAAPVVYGGLGLLKGKKACCYPGFEEELEGAEALMEPGVVDGNMITSRGMGTAIPFALQLLEIFNGKEAADKMAEGIIYNG